VRVSNNMGYEQVKTNIGKNREEMMGLQQSASSMKRINRPSDDPVGTAKVLAIRTSQLSNEQYLKNIDQAKAFLDYTDTALGELTEVISRAKELAISQANEAGASAITRMTVATEVEQLFNTAINIGNRRIGERYIFGGFKTTDSPFDNDGRYQGDAGNIMVEFQKGTFVPMNMTGDKVFLGKGEDSIAKIPKDRRGANTPNAIEEPKSHDKTPELELRGPASEQEVHQAAAEVRGSQKAEEKDDVFHEGENLFILLQELKTGLRTNDTTTIQNTLERLDTALEQVVLLRSQVGNRVQTLDQASMSLQTKKVEDGETLSRVEDADLYQVFSDITKSENTLKATLQTSGKLIQPSLLDFLR